MSSAPAPANFSLWTALLVRDPAGDLPPVPEILEAGSQPNPMAAAGCWQTPSRGAQEATLLSALMEILPARPVRYTAGPRNPWATLPSGPPESLKGPPTRSQPSLAWSVSSPGGTETRQDTPLCLRKSPKGPSISCRPPCTSGQSSPSGTWQRQAQHASRAGYADLSLGCGT